MATMSNEHRDKIKNSNILSCLIAHAEGAREMSATQVTAGLGLLKKCLPDLQAVEHSGDRDNPLRLIVTGVPRPGDAEKRADAGADD